MLIDQVTVTDVAAQAVAADAARRWLVIQNTGAVPVFIKIDEDGAVEVTVDNGFRLVPDGQMFISASDGSNPAKAAIRAVCASETILRIQGGSAA